MLSFHNDQQIKEKYLNRVRKNRELDNIVLGIGLKNGKGCAVGCTLENYDHSRYLIELGIPEWLAYLEDRIFENLSNEESIIWPELFLSSINIGIDLEPIKHKLAIKRMDYLINIQNNLLHKNPDLSKIFISTINCIELIKKCHESELNKIYCFWSAAESAAESAGESARSAAESAAWSAESAWSAWSAARSAWSAARSAAQSAAWSAESAESAAWSAAWSAEKHVFWKIEAKNLIELLKECK